MSTLSGRRIVITRPAHHATSLTRALEDRGAQVVVCPVIERVALIGPEDIARLWTDWRHEATASSFVCITSTHTVELLVEAGVTLDVPVATVGPATAQAVRNAGWDLLAEPASDARTLLDSLMQFAVRDVLVWIPQSIAAAPTLVTGLASRGAIPAQTALYAPRPTPDAIRAVLATGAHMDAIVFHSPSAVRAVVDAVGWPFAGSDVVCVGETTAESARSVGIPVTVCATEPSDRGLVLALERHVSGEIRHHHQAVAVGDGVSAASDE